MSRKTTNPHKGIALETTAKLLTNMIICICAVSAVIKLWPHYQSTQEKLQAIDGELNNAKQQLTQKKDDFSRHFDPSQVTTIVQEQSNLVDPKQVPIIWVEKDVVDRGETTDVSKY
ncbi:MAG: hypothetical protein F6K35_22470 [Okeania sp. SIO2H7]|nr:hypothetical protein [Okeania sp. SIO2H7]